MRRVQPSWLHRRGIRALAAFLLTSTLLIACAAGPGAAAPTAPPDTSPGSAGAVTIGFAAREFERQAYEPLIAAFNAQNPDIHVQYVALDEAPSQSLDQLMRQTVSAADTAAVFFLRPEDIKNGQVRDLKPMIDADATFDRDDFYPGALATSESGDGVYLLPHTIRISLLSYNKDLWARRGLQAPKTDWTWNDLLGAAEQLAQKRGDTVDVYGLLDWSGGVTPLQGLLEAAGVNLSTVAEQIRLDRPEVAQAIERVAALAKSGAIYAPPDSADQLAPDKFQKLIDDQRAAMWFGGPVLIGPNTPKPAFAVGAAPLPPLASSGFDGAEGYIMSSGAAHPQEAWRWLSFLSRQELTRPFMNGNVVSLVPARKSLAERSGYWKQLDDETTAAVLATLARAGSSLTSIPTDHDAVEALGQALTAVIGGKPTTQALADAQASLDKQIAAAQATPSPTPDRAPVVVATPESSGPALGAATITFNVPLFQSDQLRRLASEFNRQHPEVYVQIKSIELKGPTSLADMAAASDCFTWPDPAGASQISGTLNLAPLADSDVRAVREPPLLDDYPPALLAPFKRGTSLYGLPYQLKLPALTYNQTAFEAAGLANPNTNWTTDDFLSAAKQLTNGEGGAKRYGYASLGAQTEDLRFFMSLLGAPVTHDGAPNFTDPKVEQAARFYIDLLKNYSPHKQIQGYTRDLAFGGDAFKLIDEGRVGMWFDAGGINIVIIGPGAGGRQNYTRAIAPPPGADKATPDDFQVSGLYIAAKTQHPDTCWQWLKFLSGDLSALDGSFPARRSLAESQAFASSAPAGAAEVYMAYRPALDRAPDPSGVQNKPASAPIDLFWFFRAVDRALQGKELHRELADAQALTEQYLTCVRSGTAAETCATQVDPTYQGFAGSDRNN